MPHPHAPPTPSTSRDLAAKDSATHLPMEGVFALPPPAVSTGPKMTDSPTSTNSSTYRDQDIALDISPTLSAKGKTSSTAPRQKRTSSGATKIKDHPAISPTLPPPPSRARKIIQMKPKNSSGPDQGPSSGSTPAIAAAPPAATSHTRTASTSTVTSPSNSKKKQPSATSAAGRKIARKTAHSIIERRRRSKMNEEFGVLKDMIPACEGVEMHKLAILQAGIEYVRYLEGCVTTLKDQSEHKDKELGQFKGKHSLQLDNDDDDDEDEDEDSEYSSLQPPIKRINSASYVRSSPYMSAQSRDMSMMDRRASLATSGRDSTHPSPDIPPTSHAVSRISTNTNDNVMRSYSHTPSVASTPTQTPNPTLLSPAFGAFHFSPDLARTGTNSTAATSVMGSMSMPMPGKGGGSCGPSPMILPLPQAAMEGGYSTISPQSPEVTATAALMMLTNDRRGTSISQQAQMREKAKGGMSVRDLLSS